MINSPYVKDSSEVIFKNQNESFKQGKEVKKSKDSGHRINTPKGKDNTLVKRLSEDVDERNHMPFMKPKYKKPPNKKLNLHKKPKGNLNKNHPNDDQFTRKSNHMDNQQDNMYDSNLGPADDDALLEEQLNWINEMAREKYGSSEQIDEIQQKQRKKYRFQLRDYMKALKTVSPHIYNINSKKSLKKRRPKMQKEEIWSLKLNLCKYLRSVF